MSCSLNRSPLFHRALSYGSSPGSPTPRPSPDKKPPLLVRENIYTLPNLLTVSRIIACPVLGLAIVNDNFYLATGLLVYAGLTDLVCRLLSSSVTPA